MDFKKILKKLILLSLFIPSLTSAAINAPWSATSTDIGGISPGKINGSDPGVLIKSSTTLQNFTGINSTTTNATSSSLAITGTASTSQLFISKLTDGCLNVTSSLIGSTGVACGSGGGGTDKLATSTDNISNYFNSAGLPFGFVGIGTTTPQWLLQIASTSANATNRPQLALTDMGAGTNLKHWIFRSMGGQLAIGTSSDSFSTSTKNAITIDINGQVGIGVNAPAQSLDVLNSIRLGGAVLSASSVSGANIDAISGFTCNSGAVCNLNTRQLTGSAQAWNFQVRGSDGTTHSVMTFLNASSATIIDTSYIGIHTTSPGFPLHVQASSSNGANTRPQIGIADASAGSNLKNYTLRSMGGWFALATSTDAFATSSVNVLTVSNNGLIGVGKNTPVGQVDIAGTLLAAGNVGFGTTTPAWALQVASSTASQLTLSDAINTDNHWSFRNAGGSLYFGTSSPTTYATSSTSTMSFLPGGVTGLVSIGTTSALSQLYIDGRDTPGTVYINGSAAAANAVLGGNLNITAAPSTAVPTFFTGEIVDSRAGGSNIVTSDSGINAALTFSPSFTTTILNNALVWQSGGVYSALANQATPGNVPRFSGITASFVKNGTGTTGTSTSFRALNTLGTAVTGLNGTTTNAIGFLSQRSVLPAGATTTNIYGIFLEGQKPTTGTVTNNPWGIYQSGETDYNYFAGNVGGGTTSPAWNIEGASTTRPQLTLTDPNGGTDQKHWSFRSSSGNLYIATSSDSTFATSSAFALRFDANGHVYLPGLTQSGSSQTYYACGVATTFEMVWDTTTCLVSALKFKTDIHPLNAGLAEVLKMQPVTYYNKDKTFNSRQQIGFIANWSEKVLPLLVTYDNKGDIHGFNYEQYTSVLTKAVQDFYKQFQVLVARVSGLEKRLDEQQKEIDLLKEQINKK